MAAGREEPALLLADLAYGRTGAPVNDISLSRVLLLADRIPESLDVIERAVAREPNDVWIRYQLAVCLQAANRTQDAVEVLRSVIRERPDANIFRYFLGSALLLVGQIEEANRYFDQGVLITCGDGSITSTRVLRVPLSPFGERPALQLERRVEHAAEIYDSQCAFIVCGDARYVRLFAKAALGSVLTSSGLDAALHVHVVNPETETLDLLNGMRESVGARLAWSCEWTNLDNLTQRQQRVYHTCARFLVLPDLLARYRRPVFMSDIDQLVVGNLGPLLADARQVDVGLFFNKCHSFNVLSVITATFLLFQDTEQARDFAQTVADVLSERMCDPAGLSWHLDQAALACAYFSHPELVTRRFAPDVLDSSVDLHGIPRPPASGALLWSITATLAQNFGKMSLPLFTDARNAWSASGSWSPNSG